MRRHCGAQHVEVGLGLADGPLERIDVELPLETTAEGAAGTASLAAHFTATRP